MRHQEYKLACKILGEIDSKPELYYIIHYSCGKFNEDGHSAQINSIAVYSYKTGQCESFSIHLIAEKYNIKYDEIEEHYHDLEKEMLESFFEFAQKHSDKVWIHWNMRDVKFGFQALTHRLEALMLYKNS